MNNETDVFVIGGGPAGLATAIAARGKGLRVAVADCNVPPIDKPCGEGLMPDGLEALRSLGVEVDESAGHPFQGIRFIGDELAVDASFPKGQALGIRRTVLHAAMVRQAEAVGVDLRWGADVEGIAPNHVIVDGRAVTCGWIVGADGSHSLVRGWAGLDASVRHNRRFGFRRHFRIAPWAAYMELYWGQGCQVYVTPVAADEVCVAVISPDQHLRLTEALVQFPVLEARLASASYGTSERGAVSASRKLQHVYKGCVALVGDASGSVDAITGEGLCLAFRQSLVLAECLASGDLARYEAAHRRITLRPAFMADAMLSLADRTRLRRRTLRTMAADPRLFARMLALHVGALSPFGVAANALAFGWRFLTV